MGGLKHMGLGLDEVELLEFEAPIRLMAIIRPHVRGRAIKGQPPVPLAKE
eukprot:NODE_10311_length_290_cov_88.875519_g8543_i0.p2 GENE.NODE_10311_length_290_cov_88.875519_g8543_i0~~NODE_10311_length_290_cov_88.875519_g8543_i0.p2  ORF type:complete len:58 (+),score=26.42 NODE_10311_length_290_cov_88.875519_g8543_i0:25-174(+)